MEFSGRIQNGQNYRGRLRYEQNNRNDYRRGNFRGNVGVYQNQNFRRQNNRGRYRGNYRNENYGRERGRSRSRERSYSSPLIRNNRSNSNSGQSKDQEQVLIETGLGVISVESMII